MMTTLWPNLVSMVFPQKQVNKVGVEHQVQDFDVLGKGGKQHSKTEQQKHEVVTQPKDCHQERCKNVDGLGINYQKVNDVFFFTLVLWVHNS